VSADGRQHVLLKDGVAGAGPSPDGARFAGLVRGDAEGPLSSRIGVFRASDAALEQTLTLPLAPFIGALARWSPDSRAITYLRTVNGVSNIWALPIDGAATYPLTRFQEEQIFSYAFSQDGTRLAMSRGRTSGDIVLIRSVR